MPRELPRELQLKVIARMGIDGRRALGVFGRLRVPAELASRISGTFIVALQPRDPRWSSFRSRDCNLLWACVPHADGRGARWLDAMVRSDMPFLADKPELRRALLVASSWVKQQPLPPTGWCVRAGVPEGSRSMVFGAHTMAAGGDSLWIYVPAWPRHGGEM